MTKWEIENKNIQRKMTKEEKKRGPENDRKKRRASIEV